MKFPSFFFAVGEQLHPLPVAAGAWTEGTISGPAVCGVLARSLEREIADQMWRPARVTVDMFRPVRMAPVTTETKIVRDGRRIKVVDSSLVQDDRVVARASAVFARLSEDPPGEIWAPALADDARPPLGSASNGTALNGGESNGGASNGGESNSEGWYWSSERQWTNSMIDHQNSGRKRVWVQQASLVEGEASSPFVRLVTAAEVTSMLTNWGSKGIGFVNADLTVQLARLPQGQFIGLEAQNHASADGVAMGTTMIYDEVGIFGSASVCAVVNAALQLDMTSIVAERGAAIANGV
ncbi:acyl-CoA thioesterase domain-containing protein [Rhodococcoides yunnanense]|uniref:acyl-CoA thioesterase domain-containing protein n=1 Tax=Rhodococcoides yunnanense TaxID=278209 RepID=UPI0014748D99|nr:acyl-CoA thioesterase domain-containing protein [Rhodococcus yunnanensis]